MNSVYGDFSSDDILAVQRPPMVHYQSTMNINEDFFKAIEAFFRNAEDYSSNEAYRVDAIQNAAFYLFFKAELLLDEINNLIGSGKNEEAVQHQEIMCQMMLEADRLLASHPIHRLDRWENFACKCSIIHRWAYHV